MAHFLKKHNKQYDFLSLSTDGFNFMVWSETTVYTWTDFQLIIPPFLMHLITESIFFCIIQTIQL